MFASLSPPKGVGYIELVFNYVSLYIYVSFSYLCWFIVIKHGYGEASLGGIESIVCVLPRLCSQQWDRVCFQKAGRI